jgi:DNA polymerase-3 subunit alpha
MAAVLSNNMNDIKQVTFFMEECKRMKLPVLGPDVNESEGTFTVNSEGALRFGLLGMKGVGGSAVDFLLANRAAKGSFTSVFDVARRLDLRLVNKGTWESLALGGAFDRFDGIHRAMFFAEESDGRPFVERLRRYGQAYQDQLNSAQVSLFGEDSGVDTPEPTLPQVAPWNNLELLKREKEVIGIYVSAHPLDAHRFELQTFRKHGVDELSSLDAFVEGKGARDFAVAGIITNAQVRTTRTGREMGSFVLEDVDGSTEFVVFGQQFLELRSFFVNDLMVLVRGRVQRPAWARDEGQAKLVADIHKIQLLSELFDREARGLTLYAAVQDINPSTWGELSNILGSSPGKQRLQFHIGDAASQTQLRMPSRGRGVQITPELLADLDQLKHFHAAVRLD